MNLLVKMLAKIVLLKVNSVCKAILLLPLIFLVSLVVQVVKSITEDSQLTGPYTKLLSFGQGGLILGC